MGAPRCVADLGRRPTHTHPLQFTEHRLVPDSLTDAPTITHPVSIMDMASLQLLVRRWWLAYAQEGGGNVQPCAARYNSHTLTKCTTAFRVPKFTHAAPNTPPLYGSPRPLDNTHTYVPRLAHQTSSQKLRLISKLHRRGRQATSTLIFALNSTSPHPLPRRSRSHPPSSYRSCATTSHPTIDAYGDRIRKSYRLRTTLQWPARFRLRNKAGEACLSASLSMAFHPWQRDPRDLGIVFRLLPSPAVFTLAATLAPSYTRGKQRSLAMLAHP